MTAAHLHPYWIKFSDVKPPFRLGVGVTAFTEDDALNLVREVCFDGGSVPDVQTVVADIRFADLDAGHVVPNMHPMTTRGVWFPQMRAYS